MLTVSAASIVGNTLRVFGMDPEILSKNSSVKGQHLPAPSLKCELTEPTIR